MTRSSLIDFRSILSLIFVRMSFVLFLITLCPHVPCAYIIVPDTKLKEILL